MIFIRSTLYNLYMALSAIFFGIGGSFLFFMPREIRFKFISGYAKSNMVALRILAGLDIEVTGRENIHSQASIIMCKHQSTWETYALQTIFPQHVWVLKKQLLKIPFFGWGLAMLEPIAIDRRARKKAMDQIIEQGLERIKQNLWIVIFPEGTRIPAGKKGKYKLGGARLAEATKAPIIPVAHNAGEFWPKGSFLIKPGKIKMRIGSKIDPAGKTSEEINEIVENWIEGQMEEITDPSLKPIQQINLKVK